jgi:F-type H+-transporting ATPase subunit delta
MANATSLALYSEAFVDALPDHVNGAEELRAAQEALHAIPNLASYLGDRSISTDDKRKALCIALPDASDETRNFVILLAKNNLIGRMERIIETVKEALAAQEGRLFAHVTSAIQLTNEEIAHVANALKARFGKPFLVETSVDESLKGGITVCVGDWVFDATIRGRLERMKKLLTC